MAWMRTSVSLIGFGFTIFKFFQFLRGSETVPDKLINLPAQGPRNFGVMLIALGIFLLATATVQHFVALRKLKRESGLKFPVSLTLVSSILFLFIGLLAMLNVLFRIGPL